MDQETSRLREEVEQTRERVAEDVEALGHKTDIGAQVGEYVDGKKDAVGETIGEAREAVTAAASRVAPVGLVRRGAAGLSSMGRSNPLGMAIAGAGMGFVAGMLVPLSRMEAERLGDLATSVKDTVGDVGGEVVERGQQVARAAMETAREEGAEQSRQLVEDLRERTQEPQPSGASQSTFGS